jgi:transcriptional regulator with XRE-family HTH domain
VGRHDRVKLWPMPDHSEKFAEVLWAAIKKQGLTYRETALRAREYLPPGSKLSDVSVWSYAQGRSLPRRRESINALEKALGVDPGVLLALHEDVTSARQDAIEGDANELLTPNLEVADMGDGTAHLRATLVVSWPVALRILERLQRRASAAREPKMPRSGEYVE